MDRRIPNIMGTQHPDNANVPFFKKDGEPFVSAFNEINEAYQNCAVLDADEYMWDWEGKHADSSVIDRLYSEHYEYFKKHPLGNDKFLTFRLPNIWEEKGYSLMQAMTTILLAEDFADDLKFKNRPLFEAILPMARTADQLLKMEEKFSSLAHFKDREFGNGHKNTDRLRMIPLFESFEAQYNAPKILKKYVELYKKNFGEDLKYMRVFLAGSDSALSNGFLNSIIGNKLALTKLGEFSTESGIDIYPIAGTGSTIFRGGLSPKLVDRYLEEFPGLKTATIQSAFRYDYPLDSVVKPAIAKLRDGLQHNAFKIINDEDQQTLLNVADKAAAEYHKTLDPLINDLQSVFDAFPKRRDRHQHVGIIGYSRDVDGYKMPRAITFTGSLYSVGVPPEVLGTGRILQKLDKEEFKTLTQYYPNIKDDFEHVLKYFSANALDSLIKQNNNWQGVKEDVDAIQDIFDITAGPTDEDEMEHAKLANDLVRINDEEVRNILIEKMAKIRHFLG
ncbi:phosphoenolpyruvate carboxylase [Apilactobacillus timberlakei]|uniref:phosphoenolpyruvate carboxylase n=1 Tax=Apilactobacillus timberlakei TaxID=2008380 RepID=UPI0011298B45|nr:phosphoenolpyruvate carboxylase [Apilactobacillus timberlakei]TPR18799.1 phosphoenolpyruvate carboxylase [Apilactobacillus timberlakei]TPR21036.1 phosphoenolpyruvate carboxylase [Apilactobacillus timberlakei]TPR23687.1 phosphoenolpyruvate carboxylase [Apilactobacillus timberlakei]